MLSAHTQLKPSGAVYSVPTDAFDICIQEFSGPLLEEPMPPLKFPLHKEFSFFLFFHFSVMLDFLGQMAQMVVDLLNAEVTS